MRADDGSGSGGIALDAADHTEKPLQGRALSLSGGGYRAMLFHAGALWRLNEGGYLPRLDAVASVSGGSITSAVLATSWPQLAFDADGVAANFEETVVARVRSLADHTIDTPAFLLSLVNWGSAGRWIAHSYRKHLFGRRTLGDLPSANAPHFIIHATSLQTGALVRFSRTQMADYRVGAIHNPRVQLATAVAASSAFPPFLAPVIVKTRPGDWTSTTGADLHTEPYTRRTVMVDGGVYDNLGLQSVWGSHATVLVSDGGGHMEPNGKPGTDPARLLLRVHDVTDNQVRALRKEWVIESYKERTGSKDARSGTYWGIRTNITDYPCPDPFPFPHDETMKLAREHTRLAKIAPIRQQQLINWGYAVCDTAMRAWVEKGWTRGTLPYGDIPVA